MAILTAAVGVYADSNLPFDEPFEYVDGASLEGTNGWWVTGDGSAIVTNRRLRLDNATLSNIFAGEQNAVTITLELQPKFSENSPSEVIPADATYAFFVGANGLVNAYNGTTVVELSHDPLSETQAVEMTIRLDYLLRKWSLWVGGVKAATDFNFYAAEVSGFREVSFFDGSMRGFTWLDSVTIAAETSNVPGEISFLTDAMAWDKTQTNISIPIVLYPAQPVAVAVDHAIQSVNTADGGVDYPGYTPGTLVFAPGQTTNFITFPLIQEAEDELIESIVFRLYDFVNAVAGQYTNCLYTIFDNTNSWLTPPFIESFETMEKGDLNGQRGWRAVNAVAQSKTVFAGSQAAMLAPREHSMSHAFNGKHDNLYTDVHVRPVFGDGRTPPPGCTTAFFVRADGHVCAYDGSQCRDLTPPAPVLREGQWIRFTVYSDYKAKRWKLYVNGKNVAVNGLAFYNASATGYMKFELQGCASFKAQPKAAYLDEVTIDFIRPEGLSNNGRAGLLLIMR